METLELDSFITKFKGLWNSGLDAHLELNTHAGQAWVNLRVRLGHAPGPMQPHFPHEKKSRNGPARQRRRTKRAAEKAAKTEEVEHGAEEATSSTTEVTVDDTVELIPSNDDITEKVMEKVTNIEMEDIGTIQIEDKDVEQDDPAYCFFCKNSDELESEEDLSCHMMNDHDAKEVLAHYGKAWIEERRHFIRRGSPFVTWFSTPPI